MGPGVYPENLNYYGKAITVVSCQGPRRTQIGPGLTLVHFYNGEGSDSVLDGFRLYGGTGSFDGGGVRVAGASPTIRNCIITNCRGRTPGSPGACQNGYDGGNGGGAYILNGSPTFVNCFFTDCRAGAGGPGGPAGTWCGPGSPGSPGHGGALYLRATTGVTEPLFVNCTFWGNDYLAGSYGRELYAVDSAPTFRNCIMEGYWPSTAWMVLSGTSVVTVEHSRLATVYAGTGNVTSPAGLTPGTHGEMQLSGTSPLIDIGYPTVTPLLARDFENDDRILGGGIDMGADEFFDVVTLGSAEDFVLETTVDGCQDPSHTRKVVGGGESFVVSLTSPQGLFVGASPVLGGQFAPPENPPFAAAPLFIHLDVTAALLLDGLTAGPLGSWGMGPPGIELHFTLPFGLAGNTFRLQGLAFGPEALNGSFATTDAHDLVFAP